MNLREEFAGKQWGGLGRPHGRETFKQRSKRGEGAGYVGKLWTEGTARAEAPRQRGRASVHGFE